LAAAIRFRLRIVIHSTYLCHSGWRLVVDIVSGDSKREPRRDEYVTSMEQRIARRAVMSYWMELVPRWSQE